jgi:hypothetical protein
MKERNIHVNVDNLGQAVITFDDGLTIMVYQDKNQHFKGFNIRSVDDAFKIRMSGAVNVLEIEARRIGT